MSGLSLRTHMSNLKSVSSTFLELFAFNSHFKLVWLSGPLCTQRQTFRQTHMERTHYLRHSLHSLGGDNNMSSSHKSQCYLFDIVMTKSSDKLRFSHGDCMTNSQLSITIAAPSPHLSIACQSQRVLWANWYVSDEMTTNSKHLLRSVVTAGTWLRLTNQPICQRR